jgi:hypothetical protein
VLQCPLVWGDSEAIGPLLVLHERYSGIENSHINIKWTEFKTDGTFLYMEQHSFKCVPDGLCMV